MKTKLIAIIIGTCVSTLFTNCTIEKRLFQPGYSIEWKKKAPSGKTSEELTALQHAPDDRSEKQKQEEKPIIEEHSSISSPIRENMETEGIWFCSATKISDQSQATSSKMKLSEPVLELQPEKTVLEYQKDEDDQTQITPRKFEPTGIASFVFYFLGLGLGLCAIVATNPVAVLGFTALFVLTALILGIVSAVKFRRNRELYEGNFFGYFGLFASAGTLVLGIFILTITAILFLSDWP